LDSLWSSVQGLATKFGFPLPPAIIQAVETYLRQINGGSDQVQRLLPWAHLVSNYAHVLFLSAFCLMISLCIFSIMNALNKTRQDVPKWTILAIFCVSLLLLPIASVSGVLSIGLASQCDHGMDKFIGSVIDSSTTDTCAKEISNFYLFCDPWVDTTACRNPFFEGSKIAQQLLDFLPKNSSDRPTIEDLKKKIRSI